MATLSEVEVSELPSVGKDFARGSGRSADHIAHCVLVIRGRHYEAVESGSSVKDPVNIQALATSASLIITTNDPLGVCASCPCSSGLCSLEILVPEGGIFLAKDTAGIR